MPDGKKAWRIGRDGEVRTKKLLESENFFCIRSDVDSQGVDILAFKDGEIYLIEVKATSVEKKSPNTVFGLKQRKKYFYFKRKMENNGFKVNLILFYWYKKFKNGKQKRNWSLDIIKYDGLNDYEVVDYI